MVSHASEKSLQKISMTDLDKNNDVEENEELLDDTIEYFDTLENLQHDLKDYSACSTCELEKLEFCAEPCGHMMCSFCIEDENCKMRCQN